MSDKISSTLINPNGKDISEFIFGFELSEVDNKFKCIRQDM